MLRKIVSQNEEREDELHRMEILLGRKKTAPPTKKSSKVQAPENAP
jgi:hypothetical protein